MSLTYSNLTRPPLVWPEKIGKFSGLYNAGSAGEKALRKKRV
jgi:hypothetical protein